MNKRNNPKPTFLSGEQLFRYYWGDMGSARSYAKLAKWCGMNGMRNPVTMKLPTRMALWFSMWRWAIDNPDVAYPIFNHAQKEKGKFYSKEQWMELLREKAKIALTPNMYDDYLRLGHT